MSSNLNIFKKTQKRTNPALNKKPTDSGSNLHSPLKQKQTKNSSNQKLWNIQKRKESEKISTLSSKGENPNGQKHQLTNNSASCVPSKISDMTLRLVEKIINSKLPNTLRKPLDGEHDAQISSSFIYGQNMAVDEGKTTISINGLPKIFYIFNFLILSMKLKILKLKFKSKKSEKNFPLKKKRESKIQNTSQSMDSKTILYLVLLLATQKANTAPPTLLTTPEIRELTPPSNLHGFDGSTTEFLQAPVVAQVFPDTHGGLYLYYTQTGIDAAKNINQIFTFSFFQLSAEGASSQNGMYEMSGELPAANIQLISFLFVDIVTEYISTMTGICHYIDGTTNTENIRFCNLQYADTLKTMKPFNTDTTLFYNSETLINTRIYGRWDSFIYIKHRKLVIHAQATTVHANSYNFKIRGLFKENDREILSQEITTSNDGNDFCHVSFIKIKDHPITSVPYQSIFIVLNPNSDAETLSFWDWTDGFLSPWSVVVITDIVKGTTGAKKFISHYPPSSESKYLIITSHLGDQAGTSGNSNLAFYDLDTVAGTGRKYELPGSLFTDDFNTHINSIFLCHGTSIYLNTLVGNDSSGNPTNLMILIDNFNGDSAIEHTVIPNTIFSGLSIKGGANGYRVLALEASRVGGFLVHAMDDSNASKLYRIQVMTKICHGACSNCNENFYGMSIVGCSGCVSGLSSGYISGGNICRCSDNSFEQIYGNSGCIDCPADKANFNNFGYRFGTRAQSAYGVNACMTNNECKNMHGTESSEFTLKDSNCVRVISCATGTNDCYVPSTNTCMTQADATSGGSLVYIRHKSRNYCVSLTECFPLLGLFQDGTGCVETCPASNPYGDTFTGNCFTAAQCIDASTATENLIPFEESSTKKYCDLKEKCLISNSLALFDSQTICKAKSQCTDKLLEATNECVATCPGTATLEFTDTDSKTYCIDSTTCATKSGFILGTKCLTRAQCSSGSTTKFNIDTNACIEKTDTACKYKLITDKTGECRDACPSTEPYAMSNNNCVSETTCKSNNYVYASENKCLSNSECKATTTASPYNLPHIEDHVCVSESECSSSGIIVYGNSVLPVQCNSDCSSYYLGTFDGTKCYTFNSCKDASAKTVSAPAGTTQNLCVTETTCKAISGYLWKPGTSPACIPEASCTDFKVPSTSSCETSCGSSLYGTNDETQCITLDECNALTGDTYLTATDSSSNKWCVTENECKSKTGLLFKDGGTCVATSSCDLKYSMEPQGLCTDTCDLTATESGDDKCLTKADCRTESLVPTENEANGNCLTEAECKGTTHNKLVDFDSSDVKTCIATCSRQYTVNGECRDTCPYYLDIASSPNYCAYDETECRGDKSGFPVDLGDGFQKYCATEQQCKDGHTSTTLETWFEVVSGGDSLCHTSTQCTKTYKVLGEGLCSDTCDYLLNLSESECFNENICITTKSGIKVKGQINSKDYCLTEAECISDNGALILDGSSNPKVCVEASSCVSVESRIREPSTNLCIASCSNYLTEDGEFCLTQVECENDAGRGKITDADTSGQKYCLSPDECRNKEGYLYDTDDDTCILTTTCEPTKYIQRKSDGYKECNSQCPLYLGFIDTTSLKEGDLPPRCLDESLCDSKESEELTMGDVLKTTDGDSQKYCLDITSCKFFDKFIYDTENTSCILATDCGSRFTVEETRECMTTCTYYLNNDEDKCLTETECLSEGNRILFVPDEADGQKRCFSDQECRDAKYFVQNSEQPICVTKNQCKTTEKYIIEPEQDCFEKCTTEKKFHKDRECFERCPTDGEFGQRITYECVPEANCEDVTLSDGKIADGVGNTETGYCVAKLEVKVDIDPTNEEESYTKEEDSETLIAKNNPRDNIPENVETKGNVIAVEVPFKIPVPPAQKSSTITLVSRRRRRRRILQDGTEEEIPIEKYEVFTPTDKLESTFIVFENPTDQEFITKITFNTEKEFTTIGKDGAEVKFKIGIPYADILIPAVPIQAEEPTGIIGIFTVIYDVYLRVISPFTTLINPSLAFQSILAQNYQHMTLYSHLDFWKLSSNDWLYVKTLKDWLAEGGLLIVNGGDKSSETAEECSNGRERNCFYEKNLSLLTGGVGALIVLAVFLIIGIVGKLIKSKKILYNIFPLSILGLKTNLFFYSVYSVIHFYNNIASPIFGIIILIILLIIILLSLKKESTLGSYSSKIFENGLKYSFRSNMKIFIITGIIYELALSFLISGLNGKPITQTIILIGLEIFYFSIISFFKPFLDKKIQLILLIQRGFCLIQSLLMLVIALLDEDNGFTKLLHMIIFLFSGVSILSSIFMIAEKLLRKREKDNATEKKEIRRKNYQEAKKEEVAEEVNDKDNFERVNFEGDLNEVN